MLPRFPSAKQIIAVIIASTLAAPPVIAGQPNWAGEGKKQQDEGRDRKGKDRDRAEDRGSDSAQRSSGKGHDRDEARQPARRSDAPARRVFEDRHRVLVHEYYVTEYRAGRCPPGLAKKNNGCMPPGQAKKWQVGRPLARDVIFYDLPPPLVVQIGVPPPGYRYVRVAADILMIAIGTGLVIEAIADLGRM